MKNILLISSLFIVSFIFSCQDDDSDSQPIENPIETAATFLPLKAGNYWVYQEYRIRPDGTEQMLDRMDSIYVSEKIAIDGLTYYILKGTSIGSVINDTIRLGTNDAVNTDGQKILSLNNLPDTSDFEFHSFGMYDPVIKILKSEPTTYALPIGSILSDYQVELQFFPVEGQTSIEDTRHSIRAFAKDIGPVYHSYFYSNSLDTYEMRLVRYKVD